MVVKLHKMFQFSILTNKHLSSTKSPNHFESLLHRICDILYIYILKLNLHFKINVQDKKCHTEYDTSYDVRYEKECSTTHVPKCSKSYTTVHVEKCDTIQEKDCNTVYDTTYEEKCDTRSGLS